MVVKIKNLKKAFKDNLVLKDVSMEISEKEIVGIIGASGAGKTTLMKLMMGMEKCTEGEIIVLDTKIPNRKVLSKIGYMEQTDGLYLELTAYQNLKFLGELNLVSKKELEERINYLLKLLKLEKHKNKKIKSFSGGMKRRLSLALALLQDPEFLILDEPTVGIDPKLRMEIWEELEGLRDKGKTILVSTHVMDEAERCDRIVLLDNGYIIAQGKPEELKEKFKVKRIEEIFLNVETGGDE